MISARQGPSANELTAVKDFPVRLVLVLLLITFSVSVAFAQTKTKVCECTFDTKDYEAYGTNGACSIFMYMKSRSCEISITGVGANAGLLKKALGDSAFENQIAVARQIFEQYLAYESKGDKGRFLEPSFIETSLVVLERAALFRQSEEITGLPLKAIDSMFVDFSKKYSKQIAETFAGKAKPFDVQLEKEVIFSVGQGYVELDFHKAATVRVVYFSDKPDDKLR